MGRLLAAFGVPHAPQILDPPPGYEMGIIDDIYRGYAVMMEIVKQKKPHAIILCGNDHLRSFWLNSYPALAVYVGEELGGEYSGKKFNWRCHTDLANAILWDGIDQGFDLVQSQEMLALEDTQATPLNFIMPDPPIPLVYLMVNAYIAPQPTPRRCYQWGQAILNTIRKRHEDVVFIASGAHSHYPGTVHYGHVDTEYDLYTKMLMERGEGRRFAEMSSLELDKSGNIELRSWIVLLGMVGETEAKVLTYRAAWHHGYLLAYWLPEG